jgi:hypothetical protein
MYTRRWRNRNHMNGKKTKSKGKTRKVREGKNWITAIEAATKTLEKTGSLTAAKKSLRKQALTNARKLFGSVGKI